LPGAPLKLLLLEWETSGELQRANGCCPDRNSSPPSITRSLNLFRRVRGNLKPLAMQLMLLHHFLAYRLKGSQADMQRDLGRFDSALANRVEDLSREVQPGRGCSYRARRFCVDRLVMLAIFGSIGTIDVGWQRDMSDAAKHGEEIVHRIEAKVPLTKRPTSDDFSGQLVRRLVCFAAKINSLANP
jgi:hypothetical protein